MKFVHFVITRFNIRINDALQNVSGPTVRKPVDPLNPDWLDIRFRVFEFTCLPSVVGQGKQNFAWIILVDNRTPVRERDRLRALTAGKKKTFIHDFDPENDLATLDWLMPYGIDDADYVITTNLDNDDALPDRFVAALHDHVRTAKKLSKLPPVGFIGARQIVQWELVMSSEAPLGWKAAWHRRVRIGEQEPMATTASAGCTLVCQFPMFSLCVLGIRHAAASASLKLLVLSRTSEYHRPGSNMRWADACAANQIDLKRLHQVDLHYDISNDLGAVLMTNHLWNSEDQRLF